MLSIEFPGLAADAPDQERHRTGHHPPQPPQPGAEQARQAVDRPRPAADGAGAGRDRELRLRVLRVRVLDPDRELPRVVLLLRDREGEDVRVAMLRP